MNYTHVNKDNKCSAGKEPADYERLQWTMNWRIICRASCRTAKKKTESESKIIIRKINLQLKKQRNSNRKGRWFLCLSLLPRFPRFSLHQSSTNILPQMIYQMFAKVQVSTGIDLINISEKIIFLAIWIDEFDKSPKRWSSYSYTCCTFGANILPIDCILRFIASLS